MKVDMICSGLDEYGKGGVEQFEGWRDECGYWERESLVKVDWMIEVNDWWKLNFCVDCLLFLQKYCHQWIS